jgi:hypothetical protein
LSHRWRWVVWAVLGAAAFEAIASALHPGSMDQYPDVANPLGLSGVDFGVIDALRPLLGSAVFLVVLASLVIRYRRSRGAEREQLKWLAFAGALVVIGFLGAGAAGSGLVSDLFFVLALAAVVFMPVAVAIAILRYRLYEIDRVISRTLVYGLLTVILGAAYVGLVLAGQAVFSSFAGGSNLAIAVSTLVVAALFLPVRSRVQGFVDRRFYRRRYDAQRTLEAFGVRLRDEVDMAVLSSDLRGVVAETLQPAHVSLWLRMEGSS